MKDTDAGIAAFYRNKTVFVTGGSGFLGKVVLEKLLRCCPDVKSVLMLLRSKKGRTAEDRVKTLFNVELFKPLRSKYPNFEEKVRPIAGDLMQERLGISDEDRTFLHENVDIVIHSAATVRFDEKLRIALQMNVIGVQQIVDLCKGMKHLEMLCHVSTAYANCDKDMIEEKIYPVVADPHKLIEAAKWMTDEMLDSLTPSLLGKYPNTYTLTKGLAEYVLLKERDSIPTVILRPSIICGSYMQPSPGWVDNYNGLTGCMVAAGKGMLRTMMYSSNDSVADIVPVDYVANSILASAWYSAVHKSEEIIVFNCTSGNVNPLTWGFLGIHGHAMLHKYPFNEIFRRPNFSFESNKLAYFYWTYVSHRIPAIAADTMAVLIGSKPKICKLYDKIEKAVDTLKFFTNKEWIWTPDNLLMLSSAVPEHEKEIFQFDMETINWSEYIEIMIRGVKQYLMKDRMDDMDKARRQVKRYRLVRWISCTLFFIMSWRILLSRSPRFRQLWLNVIFAVYRALRYLNLVSHST